MNDSCFIAEIEHHSHRHALLVEVQRYRLAAFVLLRQLTQSAREPSAVFIQYPLATSCTQFDLNRKMAGRMFLELFAPLAPVFLEIELRVTLKSRIGCFD